MARLRVVAREDEHMLEEPEVLAREDVVALMVPLIQRKKDGVERWLFFEHTIQGHNYGRV